MEYVDEYFPMAREGAAVGLAVKAWPSNFAAGILVIICGSYKPGGLDEVAATTGWHESDPG